MKHILNDILSGIKRKKYLNQQKLPSESEMSRKYGVSRHEVRRAYERLSEMGYVKKRPGIGHFVRSVSKKIDLDLTGSRGFTDKMHSQNIKISTINVGVRLVEPDAMLSNRLEISEEEPVYRIDRLRVLEEVPIALHTSFVSGQRFPSIQEDGRNIQSMSEYYREKGYEDFSYEEGTLQTVVAAEEQRELLQCPNLVPLLHYEGVWRVRDTGVVLEFTQVIYRGDYFTYHL